MPTAIQWTDETWNPTTGCTKVSRGCRHCYIDRTPAFRIAGRKFVRGATDLQLHPDRLDKPLHWRKPRRVFVNSLSDLFHEDIPDTFIAEVFDVMRRSPAHTFQVLTKRPERARDWFATFASAFDRFTTSVWPLPNVWLGVSIEDSLVTWRADVLREIPAAVRFISAEPLLGSLYEETPCTCPPDWTHYPFHHHDCRILRVEHGGKRELDLTDISWVIIGGESGPGARPFHLEHAREIIDAAKHQALCALNPYATATAWVHTHHDLCDCGAPAVFVKQLGADPRTQDDEHTKAGLRLRDRKGGDMDEWPADLRIREFPRTAVQA